MKNVCPQGGMEATLKLLTITVPSYNVEKTLAATLDSLCLSDLIDKLDIIVVDDGSKDSTKDIGSKYANAFPDSVRVISKVNGGHGSAVNTGIENAKGKYFKVVDGDDRLSHEGLLALLSVLEKEDADLVASNYKKVFPDGSDAGEMNFEGIEYGKTYAFSELPVDGSVYFGIHGSTFKTEVLQKHDIKLQEHTFYVDTEYALLPIPYINTVVFLKDCVYLYTVGSSGQSIDPANFVKRYDHHLRVVNRLVAFAIDDTKTADKAHVDYIYAVLGKLCFTQYMLGIYYDDDSKRGKKRAKDFDNWLKESNSRLYGELGSSLYIKLARSTDFKFVPKGKVVKSMGRAVFTRVKHIFGKKKLTY